jgi:hypothetical protein
MHADERRATKKKSGTKQDYAACRHSTWLLELRFQYARKNSCQLAHCVLQDLDYGMALDAVVLLGRAAVKRRPRPDS